MRRWAMLGLEMLQGMILGLMLAGLCAFGAGAAAMAQSGGGWVTLFDGKTLDQFTRIGDANWAIVDGNAQADKGNMGYLVSKETYGDFEIRAEFWVDEKANSGIFIRCEDPTSIGSKTAYEVNVFDTRPEPEYGTGAIVGVAKVSPMPKAGGKWNTYDITAKGDTFTVILNGQKTVDGARDGAHAKGRVALQYGGGIVKFRKVEIRPL